MMTGEPVWTCYCGYTDAYLIEAMSIRGLSGSPVFINIGELGLSEGQLFFLHQTVLFLSD